MPDDLARAETAANETDKAKIDKMATQLASQLGITADEAAGHGWVRMVHPEDLEWLADTNELMDAVTAGAGSPARAPV